MGQSQYRTMAAVCLLVILLASVAVNVRFWKTETKGEDIYYAWVEGGRIVNGENPYARVLTGNMRDNDKYATYFPLFYEISALTEWAGLRDYEPWIGFWRTIFLASSLAIAVTLFLLVYPRGKLLAAIFAAAFWLFNRWTLHVSMIADLDFVPIFLLIASLGLFRKHRLAALVLFSLSLSIKQIGIFLAPLYLVWTWQAVEVRRDRLKQTLLAALIIACIPFLTSLPFLSWNAEGFAKSIFFSVTRIPADHFGTVSIDGLMRWPGVAGKLPMLTLMLLATALAWRRKIGPYTGALLIMATFVNFNAVLFRQYLVWIVPFIPLVMCDVWDAMQAKPLQQRNP
jgi:hypothetical protein